MNANLVALKQRAEQLRAIADGLSGQLDFYELKEPAAQLFFASMIGAMRAAATCLDQAVTVHIETHVLLTGAEPPPEPPALRVVGDDP